ncbi:helix-turn-helix domain-containing protein [Petrimonas sp.]|uniref:helix-turn-helix domain-containing protein n=1 Tax=Petrimonas sp. TaxID=2023866 RepID=UPI002FCAC0F9
MNEIKHYAVLYEWADWVDSQDVMQKLHISVRTLQYWRTNRLLPYSRIRGKIYYRKSDILTILQNNYNGTRKSLLPEVND